MKSTTTVPFTLASRRRHPLANIAAAALALFCLTPAAFAVTVMLDANGTSPLFWDGVSTVTCDVSSSLTWTLDKTGVTAPTAGAVADNFQIGTNLSDFNGANITFSTLAATLTGTSFNVVATNCTVTWASSGNAHFNTANVVVTVATNSTLIWTSTANNGGFNFNGKATTFAGGGTMNFQDTFCANGMAGAMVMNMPGGTNILNQSTTSNFGATAGANFTLTNGTLEFGSATALADAFKAFIAGDKININGGTIDNVSGSPGVLALGGGTYSIGGNFSFTGSSSLDLGAGAVTNTANHTIMVAANTLAIGGVISGSGLTKVGAGTLQLYGANNYFSNTIVMAGSLAFTNSGSIANSPLTASNATLDVSGLAVSMSVPSLGISNSTLVVSGLSSTTTNIMTAVLNPGGTTNKINVASLPLVTSYPATFHLLKGATVNGTLNFGLGTIPSVSPAYVAYVTNRPASGSVDLILTTGPAPVRQLVWAGTDTLDSGPTAWDVQNSLNWTNPGTAGYSTFNQLDFVQFDDTSAGSPSPGIVYLEQTVTPGSLVISNNALPYTFGGNNIADGISSLTMYKQGPGTLLLQESGDTFSGGINVSGGTVIIDTDTSGTPGGATIGASGTVLLGNNDTAGVLPSGTVNVNGTLLFNRTDDITVAANLSGSGTVSLLDPNNSSPNTVTLSGASSGNWTVLVTNGTLQAANNAALGTLPGGAVTITNGGTFDLGGNIVPNNANFGTKLFNIADAGVGGNGAIVNNYNQTQEDAFQNIALTANATIGGLYRWDMRNGTPLLNLAGFTLVKTNVNQISLVSPHVTSGNIVIGQGVLSFESTPNFDVSAGTITVSNGAYVGQYKDTLGSFTRALVLNGGGTTNLSGAASTTFVDAPILLTANSTLGTAGGLETFSGVISDGGLGYSLTEVGLGTNLLGGTNTYSGNTYISVGALGLTGNGSISATPTIVVNGNGAFDVSRLSSPLSGTNSLWLGDDNLGVGTLFLGSTTITNFNSISMSNAVLQLAVANLNIPCITVTNLNLGDAGAVSYIYLTGLPLITGLVQFPLIKYGTATGTYSMSLGPVPGGYAANLVNNTGNHSIDLQITSLPSGIWSGGATDNNWSSAANWNGTPLTGNDGLEFIGTTRLNNNNDEASETAAFITFLTGAGAFDLTGDPVALAGGITNLSSNPQTITLALDFGGNGTNISFNGGSAGLIIGGGLTNTFGAPAYTVLALDGTGTVTNLLNSNTSPGGTNVLLLTSTNANWTLVDNAASAPMTVDWDFQINSGTFNFGSGASAPTLASTSAQGAPQDNQVGDVSGTVGTLNMVNGTWTTSARLNTALVNYSTGVVSQVGGILNIGNQFQGANGGTSNALSQVSISGGTMNIGGGTGQFYIASRDGGVLTMSGSGVLNCGNLDVARNANGNTRGAVGAVNLNGGVITAGRVGTATANSQAGPASSGYNPAATFNFNGGILRATSASTNNPTTFFQGSTAAPVIPITTIVKSGGAIIDDAGWAISVLEPLQHDSTLGAAPDGGLLKLGAGTNTLTAASTYTGNTVISNGTLIINGSLGATAVRVAIGTLAGTGSLGGSVTVSPAGTISPAGSGVTGALTISGNLTLQGVTAVDINHTTATNDVINCGSVAYGGTLAINNLAGTLTTSDSFKLFNTPSPSGAFAALSPSTPGVGLLWNTNTMTVDGVLRIAASVNLTPTNLTSVVSGSTLTLSWPADHTGWRLQVQTNSLTAGLSNNWYTVAGSTTVDSVNTTLDVGNGAVFYRLVYP